MSDPAPMRPTLLDRAVAAVSPRAGLRRMHARYTYNALSGGGYTGASGNKSSLFRWGPGNGDADRDTIPDLPTLRSRSRDLERNNPLAKGAISTVVTSAVGTGLTVKSMIDADMLGLEQERASEFERAIEREFNLWAGSAEGDARLTQRFVERQDLVLRSTLQSGDTFSLIRFRETPRSIYGLKLQIIEADRVSNPQMHRDGTVLPTGNKTVGGIETDPLGAPVAIHVRRQHPGSLMPHSAVWDRVPIYTAGGRLRQVLHHYDQTRPDLTRGVPYLAPVIESLKQLGRYTESELMAAVVNSCFAITLKTEDFTGLQEYATAAKAVESGEGLPTEFTDPGQMLQLGLNEAVEGFAPGRPNAAFDPFVLAVLRQTGVALELPFEILVKHFTASYSAARAAILEAWQFFNKRRSWLVGTLCAPVYELVIEEAVARGRLSLPGFNGDPLMRQAWLGAVWSGPAMGQINPKDETAAANARIEAGISTIDAETRAINGGNFEANHRQRTREHQMRTEAGLIDVTPPAAAAPALPPPADDQPADSDQPDTEDAT